MQNHGQKIKLLKLYELLRQYTDEQHPLSTRALCGHLNDMGISCERRTLAQDIAVLNEAGFEVMSTMAGHEKAYYVEDRTFSLPELSILIDAVQASTFITPRKSGELVAKIAALGGSHQADMLTRGTAIAARKNDNESILYNVDALDQAIRAGRKASFDYFSLNDRRQRVYHNDGQRYLVDPVSLVYNSDRYYLLCVTEKYAGYTTFRLDRMERVWIEQAYVDDHSLLDLPPVDAYVEQLFNMFNGKPEVVELEYLDGMIDAVYDRFGTGTAMTRIDASHCRALVSVQLSPTFYGWVFQFGGKIRIISPPQAVEAYREMIGAALRE